MSKFNKKTIIIIIIIFLIIYSLIKKFVLSNNYEISSIEENLEVSNQQESNITEEKIKIFIHITGAVNNEGLYEIDEGSRIADVIEAAGGLKEDADLGQINLAYVLEDGEKINIPSKNDNKEETSSNTIIQAETSKNTTKMTKININTATQEELETLPGIGPSTALKIINYRKENGKFSKIEDIKNVSGIGDSKFNKIKDYIKT